jgi:D-alanine-D-alanine ligase
VERLGAPEALAEETEPPPAGPPVPAAGRAAPLGDVDVVFPALHGPFGEDGTVQGLLELADVPYVGSGVTASALCMDKDLFKAVMRDKGIPVAASVAVRRGDGDRLASPFGYPVVVKPARLGSSVGISMVREPAELEPAVALALEHDEKVLLEEYVHGVEVECSVLGNEEPTASLPGEIVPLLADWYDFASKYEEGGMDLVVPPELPQETIERVQRLSVDAFVASECEGMARVDFFVRDDGEVVVNELNTIRASPPRASTQSSSRRPGSRTGSCSTGSSRSRSTATSVARSSSTNRARARLALRVPAAGHPAARAAFA